jgi:hypothetical protein
VVAFCVVNAWGGPNREHSAERLFHFQFFQVQDDCKDWNQHSSLLTTMYYVARYGGTQGSNQGLSNINFFLEFKGRKTPVPIALQKTSTAFTAI